jgi:hypothetical protein
MEDNKWVYVFELKQKDLKEIMGGKFSLTEIGLPVIIKNSDKNGHLMPVGFLEKRWTYSAPALAALLELEGDKVVRISDEGKMQVTIKSEYGLYSYMMLPTDKADIPDEGPDPDAPSYQYEQLQNQS